MAHSPNTLSAYEKDPKARTIHSCMTSAQRTAPMALPSRAKTLTCQTAACKHLDCDVPTGLGLNALRTIPMLPEPITPQTSYVPRRPSFSRCKQTRDLFFRVKESCWEIANLVFVNSSIWKPDRFALRSSHWESSATNDSSKAWASLASGNVLRY